MVEHRYQLVLEVLEDGLPVTELAMMRHGVSWQTVLDLPRFDGHVW